MSALRTSIFVLAFASIFISCGTSSRDNASTPSTVLEGVWVLDRCSNGTPLYKTTAKFSGTSIQISITEWSQSGCMGTMQQEDSLAGTFSLGTAGESYTPIDQLFASRTMTPKTAEVAANWNKNKVCEFNDWIAGASKTFTMKECSGTFYFPVKVYDIFKITNSSVGFGDVTTDLDTSSSDKRPKKISTNVVYTKS